MFAKYIEIFGFIYARMLSLFTISVAMRLQLVTQFFQGKKNFHKMNSSEECVLLVRFSLTVNRKSFRIVLRQHTLTHIFLLVFSQQMNNKLLVFIELFTYFDNDFWTITLDAARQSFFSILSFYLLWTL